MGQERWKQVNSSKRGGCICILKVSPWEDPFQTLPAEGISSLLSYRNEAYMNLLTLSVYLFPSAFKNLTTLWPVLTKPSQMVSSKRF